MRTVLSSLAIILTLPLLGCLETAAPEPTAAAEAEVTVSDTTTARPAGEGIWWLCRPTNHLFSSETNCAASCSTTCVEQVICTDGSGRRIPCP